MLIAFPTVIYKANIEFNNNIRFNLDEKLANLEQQISYDTNPWISTTKNTMGFLEPHTDSEFNSISNAVDEHLSRFCHQLRVRDHIGFKSTQSWINFYTSNDYQESHYHPNFTFSAVFYYKVTDNTRIIFEHPVTDMMPLEVDCQTDLNRQYLTVYPKQGDLIIFRSYLRHQVPRHNDDNTKITFAYNFEKET